MSRAFTAGFALIAEIGEETISRIFGRTFISQSPRIVRTVGQATVEIWFRTPTLRLIPSDIPFQNLVEVRLPFTARSSSRFDEGQGALIVRPALVQIEIEQDGTKLIAPVIDFRGLGVDAFSAESEPDEFAPLVRAAVYETLKAEETIVAGPLFPDSGRPFYFKSFFQEPPLGNVLSVLIADPGNVPPLPAALPFLSPGVHVLIPIETIRDSVQAEWAKQGLDRLPKRIDDDAVLTALAVEYNAGHILVTGALDADAGPFTVSVNFKAWLRLWIEDEKVQVEVARTIQSTDWVGDLLNLFSAGAGMRGLEEAVPAAMKSVGSGIFGSLGLFVSEVPFEASFAAARPFGQILIRPDGLSIPVQLTNRADAIEEYPEYFRAHRRSREVHVPAGCAFGALIKAPNLQRFPTAQQAIVMGYDGCETCLPQYNVASFGVLEIWVHGPSGLEDWPEAEAVLLPGVKRFGIPLGPVRESDHRPVWRADGAGRKFRFDLDRIVPAAWKVTVRWAGWTTEGTVDVHRRWRDVNGSTLGEITVVEARFGEPGLTLSTRT
ncbi:hypothetical protein WDZ92_23660 [Nostoc sp. NIES-2111]